MLYCGVDALARFRFFFDSLPRPCYDFLLEGHLFCIPIFHTSAGWAQKIRVPKFTLLFLLFPLSPSFCQPVAVSPFLMTGQDQKKDRADEVCGVYYPKQKKGKARSEIRADKARG
jgi:hypothetical protein